MRQTALFAFLVLASGLSGELHAQQRQIPSHSRPIHTRTSGNAAFDEFRENNMNEFQAFREQVARNYAKFLEGEWIAFTPEEPTERYSSPKPDAAMISRLTSESADMTNAISRSGFESLLRNASAENTVFTATLDTCTKERWGIMGDEMLSSYTRTRDVQNIIKDANLWSSSPEDQGPGDWFKFYDMELRIPRYDYQLIGTMRPYEGSVEDYQRLSTELASQWRLLDEEQVGSIVSKELTILARKMNLNDYLRYDLTRCYVADKFPDASLMARTALLHYLMVYQGYDMRMTCSNGLPMLLLPSVQTLYARPRVNLPTGEQYYLFTADNSPIDPGRLHIQMFMNSIPASLPHGKNIDFRLYDLKLPYVPVDYAVSYGDIHLSGKINAMIMPIVHRYPQMETECFAESVIDAEFHRDIINQIKQQIAGKSQDQAALDLLRFTQCGFSYATDGAQFGFEKPYFLEENFFYPANDCEDRSIFFTYLAWNALGLESQLVAYDNHEAATVNLPQYVTPHNYNYVYMGKEFVISDPTYIHAGFGDAMDMYRNHQPNRIDMHYTVELEQLRAAEIEERRRQAQMEAEALEL